VAFGLQNFVVFDGAQLADNAIGRHHQHVRSVFSGRASRSGRTKKSLKVR
jgi:hypothetical protein